MLKKSINSGILLAAIFVFAATTSASEIGEIALFTESVGWTDVATATAQANIIINKIKITNKIKTLSDNAIGEFAKEKTQDNKLDIIITFGYFPVSLYTPGNGQAENSVGEKFLEAGNMFINTADYIFYVTQGGGANGDTGLKNITDSNFDMWTANPNVPTDDGEKYTPSYTGAGAPRSFKISQIEADPDWELEVAFGTDGADQADPAVIRNTEYDGRVCVVYQISNNALPRGEVIAEILNNWLAEKLGVEAIEPAGKLPITWSEIKRSAL